MYFNENMWYMNRINERKIPNCLKKKKGEKTGRGFFWEEVAFRSRDHLIRQRTQDSIDCMK